ncbi:hypothetical protein V6U89_16335 [Micromonospora sp. CPCC 206171]|uniref:hypothetical protein n=1 Tax=Micromonospora sp. CPCC 206171 TaxID=3122405 RepID=UPI002FF0B0BC
MAAARLTGPAGPSRAVVPPAAARLTRAAGPTRAVAPEPGQPDAPDPDEADITAPETATETGIGPAEFGRRRSDPPLASGG